MARFTENGFEIDGIVAIRDRLNTTAVSKFQKLLNGEELNVSDSGILGRIFGTVAETIALQEEALQDHITSFNPNSVNGTVLDDFFYLSGMTRLPSSPAQAFLIVLGNLGTILSSTASARSSITGDIFQFNNSITFYNDYCNGVEFSVVVNGSIQQYSLTYQLVDQASESAPITILSTEDDTVKTLAQRFVQTINNQASYIEAKLTKDNKVSVQIKNKTNNGSFYTSDNSPIINVFMGVNTKSVTYSAISQLPDSINQISNGATMGWLSVTNPYLTVSDSPVESDEQARQRWSLYKTREGFGEYDHIIGALKFVEGVGFVNAQANITSSSIGARVNQGVSIVVQGGSDQEIAQAIFDNIGVGTVTVGDVSATAVDIVGVGHTIKFSRPKHVPITLSMSLKALPNFPTNGKNIIKQRIIDYFNTLEVGDDILYSRLFNPINQVQGFSVNNLKIGRVGGNFGVNDITLKHFELATIKPEDILIGGS